MKYKKISWLPNQVRHDIKLSVLLAGLLGMVSAANIAYVPKAAAGNTATAGAGKEWPATRFVASGDCVTDNLTGLMWAKNANLFGAASWGSSSTSETAQYQVAQMNSNSSATAYHLCGYSDWRLPNQKELLSLFNYVAADGDQATWLEAQGFTNVQPEPYWSSTSGGLGAWAVHMRYGSSGSIYVSVPFYVWPVRGGQ